MGFQSTSPVWRTTLGDMVGIYTETISIHVPRVEDDLRRLVSGEGADNFNPRPPCGGRQSFVSSPDASNAISIHVPRVEDDLSELVGIYVEVVFQSTSPVWRTTLSVR